MNPVSRKTGEGKAGILAECGARFEEEGAGGSGEVGGGVGGV